MKSVYSLRSDENIVFAQTLMYHICNYAKDLMKKSFSPKSEKQIFAENVLQK